MLEIFNTYRVDAQHIASVLLALAIWRWGGGPERWLIGLFVATAGVPTEGPYAWLHFSVDLIAAAGFTVIALKANRNYPLWIAGFQLVAVGAYAVKQMGLDVSLIALVILIVGPAYCQLLLIFGGFVRHVRRMRRFGTYRDWRVTHEPTPLFLT